MDKVENPKRRFWQFHLSTAIVLVLLTGGIVRLFVRNEIARSEKDAKDLERAKGTNQFSIVKGEIADSNAARPFELVLFGVLSIGFLVIVARTCEWWIRRKERFHAKP